MENHFFDTLNRSKITIAPTAPMNHLFMGINSMARAQQRATVTCTPFRALNREIQPFRADISPKAVRVVAAAISTPNQRKSVIFSKVVNRFNKAYLHNMAAKGFEFEDQHWFPSDWRRWQMDYIRFCVRILNPYKDLKGASFESSKQDWLDLASGTGGPARMLKKTWEENSSIELTLTFSDRYPSDKTILDIDVLSDELPSSDGYTMFNAFHHFNTQEQEQILLKMSKGNWALVAEPLTPSLFTFIGIFFLTGPLHFLLAPFVSPFSWARLFWTYLLPVIPIVTCWDGLISVLRAPSPSYLCQLAEKASDSSFNWSVEMVPFSFGRVSALVGSKKKCE